MGPELSQPVPPCPVLHLWLLDVPARKPGCVPGKDGWSFVASGYTIDNVMELPGDPGFDGMVLHILLKG